MKKYTQADFDNFEVDDYGHKIYPAGDYTTITNFGEGADEAIGTIKEYLQWEHTSTRT